MTTVTKETFWTQIVEDPTLYGTITTDDNLFNYRSDAVWQVMNETFIANGTDFEVSKWEELLGLNSTETALNVRKAAILNHITENLPITVGILEQLVKEITNDDYLLEYDEKENKLFLIIPEETKNDIKGIILRVIPLVSDVEYNLPMGYLAAEFLKTANNKQGISTQFSDVRGYSIIADVSVNDYGRLCGFSAGGYNYASVIDQQGSVLWMFLFSRQVNYYNPFEFSKNRHKYEYNDSKLKLYVDGEEPKYSVYGALSYTIGDEPFYIIGSGGRDANGATTISCIKESCHYGWGLKAADGTEMANYIPAVDKNGVPCMFDKISKQPFYNSGTGQFIIGMTLEQARNLDKLPKTGGTLTVSLPSNYAEDEDVISALVTARANGWTLTIQTYTPEAEATTTTFGMRRIWVRKAQDENGFYVDTNGTRYQVEWCVEIYSPENKTPDQYGYEMFRNVESAIEYWGLSQWIDPETENIPEQIL